MDNRKDFIRHGDDIIDAETGEVLQNANAYIIIPKSKMAFSGGHYTMSQNASLEIAKNVKSGEALRVLLALNGHLDFENWININQTELAKAVGMRKEHFSRGLKELRDLNVILDGPKVGKFRTMRLNPNVGWRGTAKNHNKALKERMAAKGLSVVSGDKDRCEDTPDMFPKM